MTTFVLIVMMMKIVAVASQGVGGLGGLGDKYKSTGVLVALRESVL